MGVIIAFERIAEKETGGEAVSYNKFNAKKVVVHGETFDSLAEARRWRELTWLERGGVIKGLTRQVKYILIPNQYDESGKLLERSVTYIADFVYQDENGQLVVEDVKGYRKGDAYQLFKLKQKVMYDKYGILVREVQ